MSKTIDKISCYVIAEAGVNHNGSEGLALELIDIAVEKGADAVKFQSFKADNLVKKGTATAEYQQRQTGNDDQHTMLKQLEMSQALHERLIDYCQAKDIEFLSTPFDIESAELLIELGMKRLKFPSGELTNLPFLKQLAAFDLPIILSTGMGTLSEVRDAVGVIKFVRDENNFEKPMEEMVIILHCTSNYPTQDKDVNLRAMTTMADEFNLPVGYSDHTADILISPVAVAMGAVVIEKHFTLDRTLPGPDHQASLEPDELGQMVKNIRCIETSLGDGIKQPKQAELPVRELVRRSVVLNRDKAAGSVIQKEDLVLLRPGMGIPPKELENVVGRKLNSAKQAGSMLDWQDLSSA